MLKVQPRQTSAWDLQDHEVFTGRDETLATGTRQGWTSFTSDQGHLSATPISFEAPETARLISAMA